MAMLSLNGQVLNVFDQPPYTDKKTGEIQPAKHRVQIMAENMLQSGQTRMDLVNLTTDDPDTYKSLIGRAVRVPVGVFVSGSQIQFYALKAHRPEAVGEASAHASRASAAVASPAAPAGGNRAI
jgi:hypothetical protein